MENAVAVQKSCLNIVMIENEVIFSTKIKRLEKAESFNLSRYLRLFIIQNALKKFLQV